MTTFTWLRSKASHLSRRVHKHIRDDDIDTAFEEEDDWESSCPEGDLHSPIMAPIEAVGTSSISGSRYGELNQDHVEVHEVFTAEELAADSSLQQCTVVIVLDGHGLMGERCARRAGRAVAHALCSGQLRTAQLADIGERELQAMFEDAFCEGHRASLALYDNPPASYVYPRGSPGADRYLLTYINKLPMYHSRRLRGERLLEFGTTCTVSLIQGRTLATANVGDSTAVVGRKKGTLCSAQSVTTRHWGGNADEVRRVSEQHAGTIAFLQEDGYLSIEAGEWRGYQLSMTRALGHRMLASYGVIASPSVRRVELRADDFCVVLASDGVWDSFGENEVVRMVAEHVSDGAPAAKIAAAIARDAVSQASRFPGADADNTTCAVLLL